MTNIISCIFVVIYFVRKRVMQKVLMLGIVVLLASMVSAQTVVDYDGNVYDVVTIGSQKWLKQNLVTSHYSNGDVIPLVEDGTTWASLTSSGMSYYDNDSLTNAPIYGALYNGFVAADSRNACPVDWHVATDEDWKVLEIYADASVDTSLMNVLTGTNVGMKLRQAHPGLWLTLNPSYWGLDTYGFTALPAGVRSSSDGSFGGIANYGDWWTADTVGFGGAIVHFMFADDGGVIHTVRSMNNGYSIRCVENEDASVLNQELNKFQLFPNPASEVLFVTCESTDTKDILILNIAGEVVYESTISQFQTITTGDFEPGVYMVQVGTRSQRFIKM
jgi:uncharacterized protein (TIGR02145 family)